jgi:hypothetical protein
MGIDIVGKYQAIYSRQVHLYHIGKGERGSMAKKRLTNKNKLLMKFCIEKDIFIKNIK